MGIPIALDYSWFLIFALLSWSFAVSYYPAQFGDWSPAMYWVMGALTAVMLFVSVLIHELGHSVIALKYKIPIRSITLFIFGGVAQIANEPPSASAEFWIALAGPVTSLLLAVAFFVLQFLFSPSPPLFALLKYLSNINFMLALFNLIPGFPLDGGRVFRAVVWGFNHSLRKATLIAGNVGRFIAFLFIFIGFWQMFTGNVGDGLWIAFIGWFLESAASSQIQLQMVQSLLAGHKVADVMNRNFAVIQPGAYLQQLVDDHILPTGQRAFIVKQGDAVLGLLTLHRLKEVPRSRWSKARVDQVMIPASAMKSVRPTEELSECFSELIRGGVNQLPVMDGGKIYGMLNREDVMSFLHTMESIQQ
ncbi:MAG TPA: site-2 protease family protein [Bacteroidota bacterium]|nr:site-2 protease family protein [Bacteroidota bacterium]